MNRGSVHAGQIIYGTSISKSSVNYNADCVDTKNFDAIGMRIFHFYNKIKKNKKNKNK
jgi:hypothetical protein